LPATCGVKRGALLRTPAPQLQQPPEAVVSVRHKPSPDRAMRLPSDAAKKLSQTTPRAVPHGARAGRSNRTKYLPVLWYECAD
jgi:hypothetical protein